MVLGLPLPAPAAPRIPETVARAISLGGGIARASSVQEASFHGPVTELPFNANLVALSFRSDAADAEALEHDLVIESRFRTRDGWSSFKRLWIDPDEGPDLAESKPTDRVFTAPVWVGTADAMEIRASSAAGGPAVSDIRAHLINTKGDSKEQNIFQRAVGAVSRLLRGRDAEAMVGVPRIISRAQWGADESWRECCPRYADNVHLAFVHHTVNSNSYSASESAALVRGVYRFHARDRGWSDIGYNFIVDRYGQIFEGRAGGIELPVIGAHVQGFNTGSTGISLLGDFTSSTPTSAMVSSLQNLLAWKLDVHGVPPTGTVTRISGGSDKYPAGQAVNMNRISGHRDGQSTSCPGARAYALLPSVRSAVSNIGLPKLYLPSVSNPVVRPDGDSFDEATTLTASFSTTVNWAAEVRDWTGAVQRRFTGRGTGLNVTWDARKDGGAYIPSAPWQYVLYGADDAGRAVRTAIGTVWAVTNHPDGTLLRSGSQRVVIDDGRARAVPSMLVRDSWYRSGEEVSTGPGEIARHPTGAAMTPREGTLLRGPDGTRYIFSDGELRRFASDSVFVGLGYSDAAVLAITNDEIDSYSDGPDVTNVALHPQGSIVRAIDGSLWVIGDASRSRVATDTMRRSWYRDAEIVPATAGDVALPTGTPATYREGTLFQMPDGSLWIFTNGVRLGMDATMFAAFGYSSGATLPLSDTEAATIPSQRLGPNTPPPGIPPGPSSPPGRPVPGDWDGNGSVTPGDVRGNVWYINNGFDAFSDIKVAYGKSTDRPVAGDWNGDGTFTPAVIRGNIWYVNNSFDGAGDYSFAYGRSTDVPVAGDWDGNNTTTPAIVRGNVWYVNNGIDGAADFTVAYGRAGDIPVAGDWNGDGIVTPGVVRGNIWYLNNGFDGAAEYAIVYGKSSDAKVAGDWDGDGDWSHGVVRGATWYLRNVVAEGGAADLVYQNRM